jgi:hypothetical protein
LKQTAHVYEEFDKAKFTARSRLWVATFYWFTPLYVLRRDYANLRQIYFSINILFLKLLLIYNHLNRVYNNSVIYPYILPLFTEYESLYNTVFEHNI